MYGHFGQVFEDEDELAITSRGAGDRAFDMPCLLAVRAGKSVLFMRADELLRELGQARADHTFEKAFRRYLAPDLLILDDFGLRRLNAQQSTDLYELIIARHRQSSFAI